MIQLTVKIDAEMVKQLKNLVNNFPEPLLKSFRTTSTLSGEDVVKFNVLFKQDMMIFRRNQKILNDVIDANNEFFRTDNISEEDRVEMPFLTVQTDGRVEKLIHKVIKLQDDYLDTVLNRWLKP